MTKHLSCWIHHGSSLARLGLLMLCLPLTSCTSWHVAPRRKVITATDGTVVHVTLHAENKADQEVLDHCFERLVGCVLTTSGGKPARRLVWEVLPGENPPPTFESLSFEIGVKKDRGQGWLVSQDQNLFSTWACQAFKRYRIRPIVVCFDRQDKLLFTGHAPDMELQIVPGPLLSRTPVRPVFLDLPLRKDKKDPPRE